MKASEHTTPEKDEIFSILSELCSIFSSPARLKMIQILSQSPRSVEDIARIIEESIANTSQHLQRMARGGVLVCERKGLSRIYRISNSKVIQLWEELQDLGHELYDKLNIMEDHLTDSSLQSTDQISEVLNLVKSKKAVLLDVREPDEFQFNSLPGAMNLPSSKAIDLSSIRNLGLSKRKPIYVFCRGRYCVMATKVVRELRTLGYEAYRFRESPFQLRLIAKRVDAGPAI